MAAAREAGDDLPEFQSRINQLLSAMEDMKQHMEAYRRRAEIAESERDDARQTLAEMVEQKRKENARAERRLSSPRSARANSPMQGKKDLAHTNGHAPAPANDDGVSIMALLEKAGIKGDEKLTNEHIIAIDQMLAQHAPQALSLRGGQHDTEQGALVGTSASLDQRRQSAFRHYAWHLGPAFTVVALGLLVLAGLSDKADAINR